MGSYNMQEQDYNDTMQHYSRILKAKHHYGHFLTDMAGHVPISHQKVLQMCLAISSCKSTGLYVPFAKECSHSYRGYSSTAIEKAYDAVKVEI